ncbi:hypothetical protein CN692_24195 [Bacillus sp. AFS002410]|uniref:hypothetical protein n=1 Tax=Bacillus sp. AFS002410 TaxID=2033481 RepID=UPI000BF0A462|nr:hypothetical protein [Bacillus sp. AFS002410]PEJ48211.1 hypothetical protein CN692_24195 [Bacillus sp. AFS002410]
MNVSKTAIMPIVTVICMAIGVILGHPIGQDTIEMISTVAATAFTAGYAIWGIIKNHKKEEKN